METILIILWFVILSIFTVCVISMFYAFMLAARDVRDFICNCIDERIERNRKVPDIKITSVSTPQGHIDAGEKLMEELRSKQ